MATSIQNTTKRPIQKPVIIHCPRPGCTFAASALSMGRVDRAIAAHIVDVHLPQAER